MRYVTEANAKLIEEVLQQQIADLKAINSKSLDWLIEYGSLK